MPRTIPLQHPLDDPCLPPRQATVPTAPSTPRPPDGDIARYHHPHFQGTKLHPTEGTTVYCFERFTGREPAPDVPDAVYDDPTVSMEQFHSLREQYHVAAIMWSEARLRLQAGPLLRKAAPVWDAWSTALAELRAVHRALREIADDRWRARLLRLVDAEHAAFAAAEAWDAIAEELAKVEAEQVRVAGWGHGLRLDPVARDLGMDISAWVIEPADNYDLSRPWRTATPVVEALRREIETQRERLREVARIAGDPAVAVDALA